MMMDDIGIPRMEDEIKKKNLNFKFKSYLIKRSRVKLFFLLK